MSGVEGYNNIWRRTTLTEQLFNGNCDLQRWIRDHQMTLEELAAMAKDEQMMQTLRNLRRLADEQTRMLISRCRVAAVDKLLKIIEKGEGEVARRACVDLLKLEMSLETRAGGDVSVHLTSIDIEKHHAKLEILGKGDDDDEMREQMSTLETH